MVSLTFGFCGAAKIAIGNGEMDVRIGKLHAGRLTALTKTTGPANP